MRDGGGSEWRRKRRGKTHGRGPRCGDCHGERGVEGGGGGHGG